MTIRTESLIKGGQNSHGETTPPVLLRRRAKRVECKLFQNDYGEWFVQIGEGETYMYATDVEVSLWLELQEAKKCSGKS